MQVRSEEMAIYTHSRNLTVQIYVRSSDADLRTSDVNGSEVRACRSVSELSANVRTFDGRNFQRTSGLPTVGTSDERRDFRRAQSAGQ